MDLGPNVKTEARTSSHDHETTSANAFAILYCFQFLKSIQPFNLFTQLSRGTASVVIEMAAKCCCIITNSEYQHQIQERATHIITHLYIQI